MRTCCCRSAFSFKSAVASSLQWGQHIIHVYMNPSVNSYCTALCGVRSTNKKHPLLAPGEVPLLPLHSNVLVAQLPRLQATVRQNFPLLHWWGSHIVGQLHYQM